MVRRTLLEAALACLLSRAIAVNAQQPGTIYRIGFLRQGNRPLPGTFWNAMGESGRIEGQNVIVEARYASLVDDLPALARELVQLKVDVIMTDGTPATEAVKEASRTIPIVFAIAVDPVQRGLVTSLARPGGNLTGFTFGEYTAKQLQVLKEALPHATLVGFPLREASPAIVQGASAVGLRTRAIPVQGPADLESFFSALRAAKVDAVLFPNIPWANANEEHIAAEALKNRLPLVATWRNFARSGALMSYGPNSEQHWRSLAVQVDKILKGVSVGELPVEQPTRFELVINMKTAKTLRITLPPSIVARADEVI